MSTPALLRAQLEQLQAQHQALQHHHTALRARQAQQQQAAQLWLDQRTHELQVQARAHRKIETLQRVFYQIAERATAGLTLYQFLQVVHTLLSELLYAKNCYVCLYDEASNSKNFVYYVDERDGDRLQLSHVPMRRGLTEFVLRTQAPQIIGTQRLQQLRQQGEIVDDFGDMTFTSWLGVPLKINDATVGVLTLQDYENKVTYTASDAQLLTFVAHHVSNAIARHQAITDLASAEAQYRAVIDNVGAGVVVVQDGRMVFVNPSLVQIVGHPQDFLLTQPFTATLHPQDVSEVVNRHQRRLRGEPVESYYSFRIITQAGQVRRLELSAVLIEWNSKEATLMFVIDATARLLAEENQQLALQKQGELNAMKSRFVAMASHEFRTPLAIIQHATELLGQHHEPLRNEDRISHLDRIDEAVGRMTRMLENVLLIGRADSGKVEFKPRLLAFTDWCLALVDELKSSMTEQFKQIQLELDLPPKTQRLWLDDTLLRNMVSQLLGNAFKFSPAGSSIWFRAVADDQHLTFSIKDQGIGIPAEDVPHLFESFRRARNVGAVPGTGLGLAIVKDSVNWHHGSINVSSEAGRGSCFTVTLPITPPARAT